MSVKSVSKSTGKGILNVASWAIINSHNVPRQQRIEAIDAAVQLLQEERQRLVDELIV